MHRIALETKRSGSLGAAVKPVSPPTPTKGRLLPPLSDCHLHHTQLRHQQHCPYLKIGMSMAKQVSHWCSLPKDLRITKDCKELHMKSATPNFSSCPQAGKSMFLEPGADFFSCYLLPLPFAWLLIQMHLDQMHLVHQSNSDSTMHQPYLAAIQSIICYFNQSDNRSLKYGIILPLRDVEINSSD